MTYVKCRWEDDLGDACSGWGGSWWYFEVRPDGYVSRQVEVFDNRKRLRYGPDHPEDKFGRLCDLRLKETGMPTVEALTHDEFEAAWQSTKSNVTND